MLFKKDHKMNTMQKLCLSICFISKAIQVAMQMVWMRDLREMNELNTTAINGYIDLKQRKFTKQTPIH
jgi:hypothetical protein